MDLVSDGSNEAINLSHNSIGGISFSYLNMTCSTCSNFCPSDNFTKTNVSRPYSHVFSFTLAGIVVNDTIVQWIVQFTEKPFVLISFWRVETIRILRNELLEESEVNGPTTKNGNAIHQLKMVYEFCNKQLFYAMVWGNCVFFCQLGVVDRLGQPHFWSTNQHLVEKKTFYLQLEIEQQLQLKQTTKRDDRCFSWHKIT